MAKKLGKSPVTNEKCLNDLARVTTIGEVMQLYGFLYHRQVMYYVETGDVVAIKSGGTWLLSMDSVQSWFGQPNISI